MLFGLEWDPLEAFCVSVLTLYDCKLLCAGGSANFFASFTVCTTKQVGCTLKNHIIHNELNLSWQQTPFNINVYYILYPQWAEPFQTTFSLYFKKFVNELQFIFMIKINWSSLICISYIFTLQLTWFTLSTKSKLNSKGPLWIIEDFPNRQEYPWKKQDNYL